MNNPRDLFSPFGHKNNKKEENACQFDNPWLMVRNWYATDLGNALLDIEKQCLNELLEHIFGYNLIQLGCLQAHDHLPAQGDLPAHGCLNDNNTGANIESEVRSNVQKQRLISHSKISGQFVIESLQQANQANSGTCMNTRFDALPLRNHSIDAVILPHTLEFEQNPHQILREVERVLVAEGKAVFLGFNPFSLWGLWHKYWEVKNHISIRKDMRKVSKNVRRRAIQDVPLPSCGHLISQKRLRDWLQLLGFDIELVNEYFYRPPLRSSVLLKKLEFIERAGQFSQILPAGGYLMVATKRVSTLTPIRQGWKFSKPFMGSEASQPSAGFNKGIEK